MHTALYFPHTEVRDPNLLRTALFMWDALEFIVPYAGYKPHYYDNTMAEAIELIGSGRTVTENEQVRAHDIVEELIANGVPEVLRYTPMDGEPYEIYPQKLAHKTFRLLRDCGVTGAALPNYDYPASEAAGLSLMAILADVLAGETRARVTDRAAAYATIANAATSVEAAEALDTVVGLTLKIPSLEQISLREMIDFRKREEKSTTNDYFTLRHNYHTAIENHIKEISKFQESSTDRKELDRVFEEKMQQDFRDIKQELGFAEKEVWFSKDVITLVLGGGGLAGGWLTGSVEVPGVFAGAGSAVMLGGLLGGRTKLEKARREILRKHPMAYLYEMT